MKGLVYHGPGERAWETVPDRRIEQSTDAVVRIDTPGEANYYRNGGIMQYVLRNLLRG